MTDLARTTRTIRRRATALIAGAALAVLALTAAGCADEPKDPAQIRAESVQARIEDSFSRTEASCIMEVLEPDTITALYRTSGVPADSEAMRIYTNAVVLCAGG